MRLKIIATILACTCLLAACGNAPAEQTATQGGSTAPVATGGDTVAILLSDSGITVDGKAAATEKTAAVYTANDIVYYEDGKDFTYGEGTGQDAHSAQEAAAHTVVHITKPGTYSLSGKLSQGQIAVDLGDGAKKDPGAVVTLILNGADITCQVAPAVIFYNVYECGDDDADKATKDVDTSAAGANVIIADGSVNTVRGSYVARIYKPDSVVLDESGTKVEDADKLHKYDAAFYSKRSMNVSGGKAGTGVLNIEADNEGLDSELHLTLNGGNIHIKSGNDGINTNEDGVSVTTVNGGSLTIQVTGQTGEGDGIDSNGWLVINGGTVIAAACSNSADAGIDSDMGIHINGGTVIATGHMLDRIQDGGQNYAVFTFAQKQTGGETVVLKDAEGKAVLEACPGNAYSVLACSSPALKAGTYTLWSDGHQLAGTAGGMGGGLGMGGMPPMERPEGQQKPQQQRPEDGQFPEGEGPAEGFTPPEGATPPEGGQSPEGAVPPEDGNRPEKPEGGRGEWPGSGGGAAAELSPEFIISDGGNMFGSVSLFVTDF